MALLPFLKETMVSYNISKPSKSQMVHAITLLLIYSVNVAISGPGPMAGHGLAYVPSLNGVLLISGDGSEDGKQWLWNGTKWQDLGPSETPARSLPAVAGNEESSAVLVHGGAVGKKKPDGQIDWGCTAETLIWSGKRWKVIAETGPRARDHHAMAFDSKRKRFVLFGGGDADPSGRADWFGDTWEFDGKAWNKVADSGPPARVHFGMAYDPVRGRTVIAGGYGPNGADGKTWEWDGKTWTDKGQSNVAFRTSPRMTFDENRQKIVLFGGENQRNLPSDTYEWDGARWNLIAEKGPPGRTVHAMAYDKARKVIVLFGGAGPDPLSDVWEFSNGVWKRAG